MTHGRLDILIADDDEGDRKQVRRALKQSGLLYECTETASIAEALAACADRAFDCVIVDYRMPGNNGLRGIAALHERYPYISIIMATGDGDEVVATEAMKNGASDYISKKHIRAETIGNIIESAVAKTALRQRTARQREEQLRQSAEREQLLIAAVASSNDAIIAKTPEGVITGWNRAAEILFGFRTEEAIGQSIDIIVPIDLRSEVHRNADRIQRGEKIDHRETVRVSKEGRRIDVSLSVSPIKSPSGAIIGAATVARDITDKRQAVQALLESERMARGIIDTALDAFIQMDEAGRIIDWNPQAQTTFGWSRDEAVGKILSDLILPQSHRAHHNEGLARFLRTGEGAILGKRFQIEGQHEADERSRSM
jgi:PAS domain S-box-containing protein